MIYQWLDDNNEHVRCECGEKLLAIDDYSQNLIGQYAIYCPRCQEIQFKYTHAIDNPPESCYVCPNCIWTSDYKYCKSLDQKIHPLFRINARLKKCPLLKG